MNHFNAEAAENGRLFARANPNATGVDIDDAAPKFNPARRYFQAAAYTELKLIQAEDLLRSWKTQGHTKLWQTKADMWLESTCPTFYRWAVSCESGHSSGGFADSIDRARACIMDIKELYLDQGRRVNHYAIYNQDDACVVQMDLR